jgi:hypothetical protein
MGVMTNEIKRHLKVRYNIRNIGIYFSVVAALFIVKILLLSIIFEVSVQSIFVDKIKYEEYDIYFLPLVLIAFYIRHRYIVKEVDSVKN